MRIISPVYIEHESQKQHLQWLHRTKVTGVQHPPAPAAAARCVKSASVQVSRFRKNTKATATIRTMLQRNVIRCLPVVNVAPIRSRLTFVSARNANTTKHLNTHAAILIPVVAVRSTGVNHAIMREIPRRTYAID